MDPINKLTPVALVHQPTSSLARTEPYTRNPYGLEGAIEDESEGSLFEYWRTIVRYRRFILISTAIGLLLGFLIGIPMKPEFQAETTLEVLTINEDFLNMKQANPTTVSNDGYDTSEEQTQAKLLESNALLTRTIEKLDPSSTAKSLTKVRMATSGWRGLLHLPEVTKLTARQVLLNSAAASLKVRPTARTRVLDLTVNSTDAQLAADFANTLTHEFIAQNIESRWASTQKTSEWLGRELDETRDKLRRAEDALQVYARNSGLIFTDDTTNVATEKLQQLQQNLSTATADRISKQSRFELAQNAPVESIGDVISDAGLRDTQSKINDLKRQIADLTAVFSPEYSKVRRLQAELDSIEPAYDRQRQDIVTRIKNDYLEADRKEKLLSAAYSSQAHEVTGQDEKAIQYNILKRDVDSSRQLYDTMLQQMKQAAIASAMRASNVRVVDPAEIPNSPISPNFKLNSIMGLLAGLFASVISAVVRDRADRTLQQPGDLKLWAELPELGIIPSTLLRLPKNAYHSLSSADDKDSFPGNEQRRGDLGLVTFQRKPSPIAEAFRSTLTSILFFAANRIRPQVLVFTSPSPGEGKTTSVSNIGIAAAEIRLRTLIIDADLRRARLHQLFELPNNQGLVDILQGNCDDAETIALIRQTKVDNLHVLTSGPATHAATHLLYSPKFGELLQTLRAHYDIIIVDTPPMLQMTDARVTARLADAVVLVARSNRTTRDALIAARERFAEDGTKVMGAILNDWNPKQYQNGYYGVYSYATSGRAR